MQTDRDLWRQLSREEKRQLRKDLEKHFKLRFEVNDAIVKWFQKKHERDPSMEEVAGIRDQAMAELEPKLREELLGRGREVGAEPPKPRNASSSKEHEEICERKDKQHYQFTLALYRWLRDFYGFTPEAEHLEEIRRYLMQRVEAMLGRPPRRDRLRVIIGKRNQGGGANAPPLPRGPGE